MRKQKEMQTGTKRILYAIAASYIILLIVALIMKKPISIVFLAFLGFFIGPFMGLSFPYELSFKIQYASGLLLSLIFMIVGIKKRNYIIGQIVFIFGFLGWSFCGLIGLGTGT